MLLNIDLTVYPMVNLLDTAHWLTRTWRRRSPWCSTCCACSCSCGGWTPSRGFSCTSPPWRRPWRRARTPPAMCQTDMVTNRLNGPGSTKEWALGCVISTCWLHLVTDGELTQPWNQSSADPGASSSPDFRYKSYFYSWAPTDAAVAAWGINWWRKHSE